MRHFHLTDAEFAALAAGRPRASTVAQLRRAQLSRHLLRLRALRASGTLPSWFSSATNPVRRDRLADPMSALHTAATLAARRSRSAPPDPWTPAGRHLTASSDGLTLRVRLEDEDPLRDRLGLAPAPRLPAAAVARWQTLLDDAWQILVTRHRPAAETIAAVLSVLVPVEPDPSAAGISATSAEACGAIAISLPADPVALAVGLLHETQHSVLNATLLLFDLVEPSAERGYSPWRDDPRPPLGILHGAYAYQSVARFWRAEAGRGGERLAQFEFARWRAAVADAADGLLGGTGLTAAGRRFVGALHAEAVGWLDDPVEPEVARLAAGANDDHRARWRLRNLEPDPAGVAALAEAWRAGGPPPAVPPSRLRAAPHRLLERNDRLRRAHARLGETPSISPEETAGDGAYLNGDIGLARDAFLAVITHTLAAGEPSPPARPENEAVTHPRDGDLVAAWAGLSLVSGNSALPERIELLAALATRLKCADLRALICWLA